MTMDSRSLLLVGLLLTSTIAAQDKPAFEVASVRAHSQTEESFSFNLTPSGRLTATNMSLWNLAREAYGWRDSQITGGPAWIKNTGFDIVAQAPQPAPVERARVLSMLQTLLEERFEFHWHPQVRETGGYALRVDAKGAKLSPPKEGQARMQRGNLSVPSLTLESLCQILEFDLAKPVVDQTGLTGPFAIDLSWAREGQSAADSADSSLPSVFTAVREQLGLRLEPAKLPVRMFVVDDAKLPTAN